ncbi:MAG: site-specific DNA-methyltransferase [Defluviitaleaceae bacterium]|nr:site-specific DNA-methyltransferase [Defluviitaleaceae bacterium]
MDYTNKIINADCATVLAEMPSDCIDLTVTSPPYDDLRDYGDTLQWDFLKFTRVADLLYKVTKPGGVIVWVVGDKVDDGNKSLTSYRHALYFQEIGFNVYDVIIYEKSGTGPPHKGRYFNAFEYMFVFSKSKPKTVNLLRDKPNKWAGASTFGNVTRREKDGSLTSKGKKTIADMGIRTNIWKYNNGKGFAAKDAIAHDHPAIFPEKLASDHILSWSNEGDVILDPFAGSGTTGKIAKQLRRKWLCIEINKDYCDIAEARIKECTQQ